jgi:hypothetical protein
VEPFGGLRNATWKASWAGVRFFLFFCPQPFEKSRFGQGNKSKSKLFAWFSLHFLAASSPSGCLQDDGMTWLGLTPARLAPQPPTSG